MSAEVRKQVLEEVAQLLADMHGWWQKLADDNQDVATLWNYYRGKAQAAEDIRQRIRSLNAPQRKRVRT